jgi:UDPglucose 6-dehydrogenase
MRASNSAASTHQQKSDRGLVVVNKGTVPVGSGDYVSMLVREGLEEEASKEGRYYYDGEEDDAPQAFVLASNPEFLREVSAV